MGFGDLALLDGGDKRVKVNVGWRVVWDGDLAGPTELDRDQTGGDEAG